MKCYTCSGAFTPSRSVAAHPSFPPYLPSTPARPKLAAMASIDLIESIEDDDKREIAERNRS